MPYDEHLSGVETELPCAALSGLSPIWALNPGLAPWAVLLDPFGVLGFATETSESRERQRPVGANGSCWPLGLSSGFQGRRAAGERLTILQGEGRVYLSFESWGGSLKANSYTSQSVQW